MDLRAIGDELAIRNLVARYAEAVNQGDAEAWVSTWARDGCWTLGGERSEGHENLLHTWRNLMGLFERVIQLPQSGVIEVSGDCGEGRWSMIELGRSQGGDSSWTLGTYYDDYRREEAAWRFVSRRFEFIYAGAPDLSGMWQV
jgi:ketosteroid isomerase-like protein